VSKERSEANEVSARTSEASERERSDELGIAQARRGWAEKEDIINTQPLEKLLKYFKNEKN